MPSNVGRHTLRMEIHRGERFVEFSETDAKFIHGLIIIQAVSEPLGQEKTVISIRFRRGPKSPATAGISALVMHRGILAPLVSNPPIPSYCRAYPRLIGDMTLALAR